MLSITSFDHIQIPIPKGTAAEARHFYEKMVGCEVVLRPPAIIPPGNWFRLGPFELHTLEDPDFQASTRHPAFVVKDLIGVRNSLEAVGVRTKDTSKIEGRSRFFFYDPFGNRFELIEYD